MNILRLFHFASLADDLFNFLMYLSCYVFNWLSTSFLSLMDFDTWKYQEIVAYYQLFGLQNQFNFDCFSKLLDVSCNFTSPSRFTWKLNLGTPKTVESIFLSLNYVSYTGSLGKLTSFLITYYYKNSAFRLGTIIAKQKKKKENNKKDFFLLLRSR